MERETFEDYWHSPEAQQYFDDCKRLIKAGDHEGLAERMKQERDRRDPHRAERAAARVRGEV